MGATTYLGNHLLPTLCLSSLLVMLASGQTAENTVSDVAFKNFVQSVNDIESKLGKSLANKEENSVVCVPSAQILLGLLYAGARGKTATELEALFGVNNKQPETLASFQKFVSYLEVPEVKIANTAYVAKDLTLKKEFLEQGKRYFNITVNQVDFKKKDESAETINAWVEEKTEKLIKNLITAEDISDDAKLILLNAIYFKANWENPFESYRTHNAKFQVSKTKEVSFKQMYQEEYFPYAEDEDYQYLAMPYKGGKMSMLITLPKDHETFEKKDISKTNLSQLKFKRYRVKVKMPKFRVESTIKWDAILKGVIPSAFGPSADLSGISDAPLMVSKMIQKAFIRVDEEGTEAAAVTFAQVMPVSAMVYADEPKLFTVDRPFYYAIQADFGSANAFLFQGTVISPTY